MSDKNYTYIAIDLKSFYASAECVDRKMDPLTTNLVVADVSRTAKTICLAVSPSLKSYGISGRARLFEVLQKVREINLERKSRAPGRQFQGSSSDAAVLAANPSLELSFITAPPRMACYLTISTRIYNVYLKYIAPEDIHVYSIDEVFLDVTNYLELYHKTARELASLMIQDVYQTTGITAAAGIGTNLYLTKVAMDIQAKHEAPDANGMRIAQLDEFSYRQKLWNHRPLTDFWRIGQGYRTKLETHGLYTMGDIARCSLGGPGDFHNEELLYRLFGVNAELLIDHAWGVEPCTMADIKAYRPETNSIGSGQVLQHPYDVTKARLIVQEMTDLLTLDLVDKKLVTDQLVLTIGYDIENLSANGTAYQGKVTTDRYGRKIPKHAHGTTHLTAPTSSTAQIVEAVLKLYDQIIDPTLLVRRVTITADHVAAEDTTGKQPAFEQLDLFTDYAALQKERKIQQEKLQKEKQLQLAMLDIKKKFGKNAVLKGMNLQEGATTIERNRQIGGHKA